MLDETHSLQALTPTSLRQHHPFDLVAQRPEDAAILLEDACKRLTGAKDYAAVKGADRTPYVILSADIRRSTFLMKEAEQLTEYARIMTAFIELSREIVGRWAGWFDKFMGDGFIAYWPCDLFWIDDRFDGNISARALHGAALGRANRVAPSSDGAGRSLPTIAQEDECVSLGLSCALSAAAILIRTFEQTVKPEFRRTSRNFRADTGLTVGIDYGNVQMVPLGREVSVVGHAVVGAVRMTAAGVASDILANGRVGEFARSSGDDESFGRYYLNQQFAFEPRVVVTKEYEQEAYLVTPKKGPPLH